MEKGLVEAGPAAAWTEPRRPAPAFWRRPWLLALLAAVLLLTGALVALYTIPPNWLPPQAAALMLHLERSPYWLAAEEEAREDAAAPAPADPTYPRKLQRGPTDQKWVALTIDDGPHREYTPRILKTLEEEKVHATFFVVGKMAERYPDLVRAEVAGGHSVGNHTYHHLNLSILSPEEAETEVRACDLVLQELTGKRPRLFRPPGGGANTGLIDLARGLGYTSVFWTYDPEDYERPPADEIAARCVIGTSHGGILILHDGVEQTVQALPSIIRGLREKGYEFMTVDEMIRRTEEEKLLPDWLLDI